MQEEMSNITKDMKTLGEDQQKILEKRTQKQK